jgi:sugar lactone lactonase YvrE
VYDGIGNLYVVDGGNNRIRKVVIATKEVTTIAGDTAGFADGIGVSALFDNPMGITTDGTGNLFVADNSNSRIRKVVIATGAVTTLAGDTNGFADGTGTAALFDHPCDIDYDGVGNLFVTDMVNNRVRKVVISTGEVSTLVGQSREGFANGNGAAAQFRTPAGITFDGAGNLFVCDLWNRRVRKIVIGTREASSIYGYPYGFADGIGANAIFSQLGFCASDGAGNLYVTDIFNNRIRKVDLATGEVTTLAGDTAGFSDGIASGAHFNLPYGIAYDGSGNLFVTDSWNNRIRKIVIATGEVTTLAGDTAGFSDGVGSAALFNRPLGICYDGAGNLYVADANNNRIRKIVVSTREVITIAGGAIGYRNGTGTNALFFGPNGITTDGRGNLFIADEYNNRIRKLELASRRVTTLAGGGGMVDFADGVDTLAFFSWPSGITYDGIGNLFVADALNDRIRKINIPTRLVTTVAGSEKGYQEGSGSNALYDTPVGVCYLSPGILATTESIGSMVRLLLDPTVSTAPTLSPTKTFTLTPNPATHSVQLMGLVPASGQTITLLDISGRVLRSYPSTQTSLSLEGISPGLYVVQVGQQRSRLVVE